MPQMFPFRVVIAGALLSLVSVDGEKLSGGNFSLDGGITGGGGSSDGGSYRLLGEIARPISGEIRGGGFILQTPPLGFYSVVLGDFELEIVHSGSTMTLNWPIEASAYILESTPGLGTGALWNAVPGAAGKNSISIQAQGSAQFFRLRAPGH